MKVRPSTERVNLHPVLFPPYHPKSCFLTLPDSTKPCIYPNIFLSPYFPPLTLSSLYDISVFPQRVYAVMFSREFV